MIKNLFIFTIYLLSVIFAGPLPLPSKDGEKVQQVADAISTGAGAASMVPGLGAVGGAVSVGASVVSALAPAVDKINFKKVGKDIKNAFKKIKI